MKLPFVVCILFSLLAGCAEQANRENLQTTPAAADQTIPGFIRQADADTFKATDATILLCQRDDVATWFRAGDAAGKQIRVEFDTLYACLLDTTIYDFNGAQDVAIPIKFDKLCDSCPPAVKQKVLNDGFIEANMFIRVGDVYKEIYGYHSPPRIIIGGGTILADCCE